MHLTQLGERTLHSKRIVTFSLVFTFCCVYALQWLVHFTLGQTWEVGLFHRLHDYPIAFWGYGVAIFSHKIQDPWGHFAVNTVIVGILGWYLEPKIGGKPIFWIFAIAGVLSGIFGSIFEPSGSSLGASGGGLALMAVAVRIGIRDHPNFAWPLGIGSGLLWLALFAWALGYAAAPEGVGHVAHFSGYTIGLISPYVDFVRIRQRWENLRSRAIRAPN